MCTFGSISALVTIVATGSAATMAVVSSSCRIPYRIVISSAYRHAFRDDRVLEREQPRALPRSSTSISEHVDHDPPPQYAHCTSCFRTSLPHPRSPRRHVPSGDHALGMVAPLLQTPSITLELPRIQEAYRALKAGAVLLPVRRFLPLP